MRILLSSLLAARICVVTLGSAFGLDILCPSPFTHFGICQILFPSSDWAILH